ncbi:MAG: hypothetical protein U0T73_05345 [Chitinophagales bacterium]
MKTQLITTFFALMFLGNISAQSCSDFRLKKGSSLTFQQESAPPQIHGLDYFKKSKKEQEAEDAEFTMKVNNGTLKPNYGRFSIQVLDVTDDGDTRLFQLGKTQWGKTVVTREFCTNGVLTIAPEKDRDTATVSLPTGSSLVTNIYGYKKIPLQLKVGDTLPDFQNLTFRSPFYFEIPVYANHFVKDFYGDTWIVQTKSTTNLDIQSFTTVKYANRQVIEAEDLIIDSVVYKAFIIHNEVLTKEELKPGSKSSFINALANYQRTKVEKRVNKALGGTPDGIKAAITLEWFVPSLGVIAKTEVYDANGRKLATNQITHIDF